MTPWQLFLYGIAVDAVAAVALILFLVIICFPVLIEWLRTKLKEKSSDA